MAWALQGLPAQVVATAIQIGWARYVELMVHAPLCPLALSDSIPFLTAAVPYDGQNQPSVTQELTVKDNKVAILLQSRHDVDVTVTLCRLLPHCLMSR